MLTTYEKLTGFDVRFMRNDLGLTQIQFWGRIGLNQTTGSFYERDAKKMPERVKRLVWLAYFANCEQLKNYQTKMRAL